MGEERRGEGESVATYWARILVECQAGPIEIANKFGDVVAVMVHVEEWEQIKVELERARGELDE